MNSEAAGSVTGIGLTGLGMILGQISVATMGETLLVTFVGGMGGYLGAEFIKWARKQVK